MIKEKDFVEVEYTGKLTEENIVFDTTNEQIAKDAQIHNPDMTYGPIVVCMGEGQLLKGLENQMIGKETGQEYTITLSPEDAFGKKNASKIQMIPLIKFKKQRIMPEIGMQVNIDQQLGTVKTVAGGRCLVDFNHPLSGKEITYTIRALNIVTDDQKKVDSLLKLNFNIKADVKTEAEKTTISTPKDIPKELQDLIEKRIKEFLPQIKLEFKLETK